VKKMHKETLKQKKNKKRKVKREKERKTERKCNILDAGIKKIKIEKKSKFLN